MKKISKWIYWTPRILSMVFILFLFLFSLDIFDSCSSVLNCFFAMLMHNIPVFILAILLCIAWKKEIVGAWVFLGAGILYIILVSTTMFKEGFEFYYLSWMIQISGPAFFIAYLFYKNWKLKSVEPTHICHHPKLAY